jgi:hypothetical protein
MLFWIDTINRHWKTGDYIDSPLVFTGDDSISLSPLNTLYIDNHNCLATTEQHLDGFVYVGF